MLAGVQKFGLVMAALLPLTSQADSLTIVVTGITKMQGSVRIAVIDSKSAYEAKKSQPIASTVVEANEESLTYTVELPAGEYAVRLMHDVNGNEKLDRNLVGMPKEPYGFSNNVKGKFGPPKWKKAAFQLEGETTMTIDLGK